MTLIIMGHHLFSFLQIEESKMADTTADCNVSSIISSLDILFNQSVYDFPCHVTIVSSAELKCDEIQKQEYVNKVTIELVLDLFTVDKSYS